MARLAQCPATPSRLREPGPVEPSASSSSPFWATASLSASFPLFHPLPRRTWAPSPSSPSSSGLPPPTGSPLLLFSFSLLLVVCYFRIIFFKCHSACLHTHYRFTDLLVLSVSSYVLSSLYLKALSFCLGGEWWFDFYLVGFCKYW